MFCSKCGAEIISDDALFCTKCGAKIQKNDFSETIPVNSNDEIDNTANLEKQSESVTEGQVSEPAEPAIEEQVSEPAEAVIEEQVSEQVEPAIEEQITDPAESVTEEQSAVYTEPAKSFNSENTNSFEDGKREKNVFSFKKFIFSLLVMVAMGVTVFALTLDFFRLDINGEKKSQSKSLKGYESITKNPKNEFKDYGDLNISKDDFKGESKKDYNKSLDTFRLLAIGILVSIVLFTVIDLINLILRKKALYVFTMLFALIKGGLLGYTGYLWYYTVFDKFQDALKEFVTEDVKVISSLETGFLLAIAMQLVIFICSIVLLTCKNKKKTV